MSKAKKPAPARTPAPDVVGAPDAEPTRKVAKAEVPRCPFGEWRRVKGQWIHYTNEASVSERRLVAKRVVAGKCDDFPMGQLMDMDTLRRDDLLNSLRRDSKRSQGRDGLFDRPDDSGDPDTED